MFKAKQKLTSIVLACVMMIACLFGAIATLVLPQTTAVAAGPSYVKVTSTPTDWSGEYLIVYEAGDVALDGSLTSLDVANNCKPVTINDGTITANEEMAKISVTIAKSGSNYTIKTASGYYIGETSTSNDLDFSTSTQYTNTITLSNSTLTIKASGGNTLQFNKSSDQMRFRYFKSVNQQPIALYKLETASGCSHENTTETTVNATCTVDGSKTVICDDCGETISTTVIPAAHATSEEIISSATCGEAGSKRITCSKCDYEETVAIPATGAHSYNANGVCSECGAEQPLEATITFDNKSKRTEYSTSKQVWEENGITVTNNKAASTTNIGDYANPVRFYANSELIISATGNITKIEFTCNNTSHATALKNSIGTTATVAVNGAIVTVEFAPAVESFTIAKLAAQVQVKSIKVSCEKATDPLVDAVKALEPSFRLSYTYSTKTETVAGVKDTLNQEFTGVTDNSYTDWTNETSNSQAVYAGISAGVNNSIQLNNNDKKPGIITTQSGGKATKVSVVWASNTAEGRTLNIYGSNTAYELVADLYDTGKCGELLGTIVCGTDTELVIEGDYEFIGLKSASSAMYLNSVEILWDDGDSTTEEIVMNDGEFYLACGIPASLSEVMEGKDYTYVIEVANANGEPVPFDSSMLTEKDGMIYVVLYLGNMFEFLNLVFNDDIALIQKKSIIKQHFFVIRIHQFQLQMIMLCHIVITYFIA